MQKSTLAAVATSQAMLFKGPFSPLHEYYHKKNNNIIDETIMYWTDMEKKGTKKLTEPIIISILHQKRRNPFLRVILGIDQGRNGVVKNLAIQDDLFAIILIIASLTDTTKTRKTRNKGCSNVKQDSAVRTIFFPIQIKIRIIMDGIGFDSKNPYKYYVKDFFVRYGTPPK